MEKKSLRQRIQYASVVEEESDDSLIAAMSRRGRWSYYSALGLSVVSAINFLVLMTLTLQNGNQPPQIATLLVDAGFVMSLLAIGLCLYAGKTALDVAENIGYAWDTSK